MPVVRPEAYRDSVAWMAMYMAGVLKDLNMIWVILDIKTVTKTSMLMIVQWKVNVMLQGQCYQKEKGCHCYGYHEPGL